MPTETNPANTPVVCIRIDDSTPGYRVWFVDFAFERDGNLCEYSKHYGVSFWGEDSFYHKTLDLRYLGMRGQMDDRDNNHEPYGWETKPTYRPAYQESLAADELEIMLRTLKTIQRKLDAYEEIDGRVSGFAGQVRRLARAVGAKSVRFERRNNCYPAGPLWGLNDGIERLADTIYQYARDRHA